MFFFFPMVPMMNPILIAAAVLPAVFLLVKVYRADRLEREPPMLLVSLVLYGILATGLALLTERLGTFLLDIFVRQDTVLYNVLLYFVVVAFSEEGFKYLLLKRRTWNSPAFNCQFDGVVYATFVSLGFALWENIGYVIRYGFSTAVVRAVTAIPGHACFGVFMGAWYGLAKRYDNMGCASQSKACRFLSFFLAAFAHGCYDYIATMDSVHYGWIFVAFIAVMFAAAFVVIHKMSKNDRFISQRTYYDL
ncbi:MAG: PrsW family intramembrane metalloprotease [Candidatus Faecousia sp.]|nr:PrsW family intramembrane metalloprotease [Candidatus Faecousia sp.]